jgi:hypothetical protein
MSRTSSKSTASPNVKYVRNINHLDMRQGDLMTDTLPVNYLYSKIAIGEQAAHFFTETMLGADFDQRLRSQFADGFEKLLTANPANMNEIAEAQVACLTVIKVYETIGAQIQERESSKQQLDQQLQEDENGETA